MGYVSESALNARLARLLSGLGLDCRAERVERRKRPDIRCYHKGHSILIEASYSERDAEKDAERRAQQEEAPLLALALHYPQRVPDVREGELEELLRNLPFRLKAVPRGGWREAKGVAELAKAIESLAREPVNEERAKEHVNKERINKVKGVVEGFVRTCSSLPGSRKVAEELSNALYRLYGFRVAETKDEEIVYAQVALVLLLSSLLYESVRPQHGLRPLRELVRERGPIAGLREAMERLREADYSLPAATVLEVLSPLPPAAAPAVERVIAEAERLAQEPHLLSQDFAGRIYHTITGDIALRKGFATYYTEIPAAYMLAWLAAREVVRVNVGEDEEARRVLEKVKSTKVVDFACGSGTLLTASFYSLSRLARNLCFLRSLDCREVERAILENVYGFDALKYAAQITSINLSLMASSPAKKVYAIYFGYMGSRGAWLGSLELLENGGRVGGILWYIEEELRRAVTVASIMDTKGRVDIPKDFDIVIMNPPFTRATGRTERRFAGEERGLFGFIGDERARSALVSRYNALRKKVREELLQEAEELFDKEPLLAHLQVLRSFREYYDITQAGEGLLFVYLAYKYVKPGGVIAFVLPRNLLSGVSWFLVRALLAHKFHLRYVIVSSDNKRGFNFSESTELSECLIVAKRVDAHSPGEETVFVNFYEKPRGILEALERAEEIASGKVEGAAVKKAKREELLRYLDNLNRFAALPEEDAVEAALRVLEGDLGLTRVPMVRLGELVDSMGVHSTLFHKLFEARATGAPARFPLLYGGEEANRLRMLAEPNAEGLPREPKAVEIFSKFSGRLLLPDRVWLDTAHVIALYSPVPLLSNVFYSVRLKGGGEGAEKALALWLNTTWGILSYLVSREETRGRWMRLTESQWMLLPVIDVRQLEASRLARAFDSVASMQPARIPRQFSGDPVRLQIDLAFLRAVEPSVEEARAVEELKELYGAVDLALRRWTS
ncbi:MAG: hypothetical protein NZ902_06100 [Acidilobaceae archaeon]|nr:hypothetical protein [Acidilobaceae archaeon]MDW7974780.1 hypothetical protein [Sulfolobales archaeon]